MQVPLVTDAVEYDASWTNSNPGATPWSFSATGGPGSHGSGPYGEEIWSTTAITPQNSGVNVNYTVPHGSGAWFVAAGGGPGACPNNTGTATAWAWTARPVVSGRVTVAGSDGNLAATGVIMQALCPGGGTTKTDDNGDYGFEFHPYTTCTIEPKLDKGQSSSPAKRVVHVVDRDIEHADFTVPCGVGDESVQQTIVNGTRRLSGATAPTRVHFCPLLVNVTRLEPTSTSGLGYIGSGSANTDATMSKSPAFIRRFDHAQPVVDPLVKKPADRDQLEQHCISGCTDLLVTVRDKASGKPVEGATVTASISPITAGIPQYPANMQPTGGFLCAENIPNDVEGPSQTTNCFAATRITSANDVRTNADGHVLLQYWAPGLLKAEGVTLKVVATTPAGCQLATHLCTLGGKGVLDPPLHWTIQPNLIWQKQVALPDEDVLTIAKWADPPSLSDFLADPLAFVVRLWTNISLQDAIGKLVDELPKPISSLYNAATYFNSLNALQKQELGFILTVFKPLGLSPLGLDDTETSGFVPTNQILGSSFLSLMAGPPQTFNVGGIPLGSTSATAHGSPLDGIVKTSTGILWQWGETMNQTSPGGEDLHAYVTEDSASVQVYEVSYCQQAQAASTHDACGPGYAEQGSNGSLNDLAGARAPGIAPYLYVQLQFSDIDDVTHKPTLDAHGKPRTFTYAFLIPYNAAAWMESQFKGKSVPAQG